MNGAGISVGGARRLRKAIEAEVRRDYEKDLGAASNFWQRMMIREEIKKEVKRQVESVASPHSLYFSRRSFDKIK